MSWQAEATEAEALEAFGRWFRSELWPWPRLPEVYIHPRSLHESGEDTACLHAKCMVVDDERAFVTSANLTGGGAAPEHRGRRPPARRAIRAGLRLQFEALINREFVQRLVFPDVSSG